MKFEWQTFLKIIGLFFVTVISYGLWTCLEELEKLRTLNGNVAMTVAHMTQRSDWSIDDLQSDWPDLDFNSISKTGHKRAKTNILNNGNLQSQRYKRETHGRGNNLPDFAYDPFSQTDRVSR